jgi:hypothetical protein
MRTAQIQTQLPLGEYKISSSDRGIVLDQQNVYVKIGEEIFVIDVSDSSKPHQLFKTRYQRDRMQDREQNRISFTLPPDETLSYQQRYRIVQYFGFENNGVFKAVGGWDNERFATTADGSVCIYEKKETSDTEIIVEKIAEHKSIPLEKMMFPYSLKIILRQKFVYLLNMTGGLTIYQFNESAGTLKRLGHYAASEGNFYDMFLRDDGLITLVGISQIHIVQPPAAKKN